MSDGPQDRRARRLEQRVSRLDALIAALDEPRDGGPLWRIVEAIERDLDGGLPGPLGELSGTGSDDHRSSAAVSFGAEVPRPARSHEFERAVTDLGIDDEDLPGGERLGTLRLAFAINRELGRRLPLDILLGALPGLPGNLAEKGLLLPLSIGLATAWRLRTDPRARERRAGRLRNKRDRLAARQARLDD